MHTDGNFKKTEINVDDGVRGTAANTVISLKAN